jgi:hypothetical protein
LLGISGPSSLSATPGKGLEIQRNSPFSARIPLDGKRVADRPQNAPLCDARRLVRLVTSGVTRSSIVDKSYFKMTKLP